MSIALVLKEIHSVSIFFQSSASPSDAVGLQRSFADGLLQKLKLLKALGPSEGSQLYEALKSEPFGAEHTTRIKEAINAMLHKNASSPPPKTSGKAGKPDDDKQFLKHWWNYFLQDEMDYLLDKANSWQSKMVLLVERGMSVGCTTHNEETLRWALAMLILCHYTQIPTARDIYDKLQELKRVFAAEAESFFLERLEQFPELPEHLHPAIFEQAYKKWTPVCARFAGINTVADAIPLRGNSKLLKKVKTKAETDALNAVFEGPRADCVSPSKPRVKQESAESLVKSEPVDDDADDEEDDPDIIVLKKQFELDLAKMRARKCSVSVKAVKAEATERVVVDRNIDGSLNITSATPKTPPKPAVKEEHTPETPSAPTEADLDPWTKAAVAALESRHATNNDKKKANAAAALKKRPAASEQCEPDEANAEPKVKSKAEPKAKSKVKSEPTGKVKSEPKGKPATKVKVKVEGKPVTKVKAETKVKKEADDDDVPKSKILKAMPHIPKDGSSPKPVRYWGGVIYTAIKAKKFRALKERGNNYTEASASWGGSKPSKEAWVKCIKAIEKHHSK